MVAIIPVRFGIELADNGFLFKTFAYFVLQKLERLFQLLNKYVKVRHGANDMIVSMCRDNA